MSDTTDPVPRSIPKKLPCFIDARTRLDADGKIINRSDFKNVEDIFDFSRCLQCAGLLENTYCGGQEHPCLKCQMLVAKIKEANRT
jgi:hypothetical protein